MATLGRVATRYAIAFSGWLLGLVVLVLVQAGLARISIGPTWTRPEVLWHLSLAVAGLMPFVAFVGGAAVAPLEPLRRVSLAEFAVTVGGIAIVAYTATAFVVPTLWYLRDVERGIDVAQAHPFGPATVTTLLERRSYIESNPPSTYTYSVERPLARPPNWLDFLIHRDAALAVFTVLNSFLGLLVARVLAREGPIGRRRKLWTSGLASGLMVLVAMRLGDAFVHSSLTVSGIAMAWLPLVVPTAAIVWLSLGPARPALAQQRPVAGEKVGI